MNPKISLACVFTTSKNGSRTIAPNENFPPILILTLKLTQSLTPTGEGQSSFGENCLDTGKNKRNQKPKRNKKQYKKEKINKTKKTKVLSN